ncbi:MAG: transferase [Alphaproteobacteria bacterium RIFCSPHIGHO2_02_FULL_46_13]|nr:MAG: transferase [Alphaproteobacteria bacterium RIFCSPHIGHO2_02_FULL_46_13]
MAKVILWGTGQIAEVVYHYLTTDTDHEICAFCVDREYIKEPVFKGLPVVAFEDITDTYSPAEYKMAIPIGYKSINKHREQKYLDAKAKGYEFITYISSKTSCDAETVGENTFIFEGNFIQPFVQIGNNVIIWATGGIGHHAVIEDHCFLASPKISGATRIGRNSFLGTNATIGDNLTIGSHCIIGAAAVVLKDVPAGSVLATKQTKALEMTSYELEDILG